MGDGACEILSCFCFIVDHWNLQLDTNFYVAPSKKSQQEKMGCM